MANNYSESSSMIDCSKEVAIEAVTVLERIEQWVDDERFQRTETPDAFVAYCLASGFSLTEAQKRLVAHPDFVEEILCELDEGFADLGFNAVSEERGIWLSGGEYFNELKASGFAAAVMSAYGVGGTTLISTAHYCSKARLNEFGGNSIFVNKKTAGTLTINSISSRPLRLLSTRNTILLHFQSRLRDSISTLNS